MHLELTIPYERNNFDNAVSYAAGGTPFKYNILVIKAGIQTVSYGRAIELAYFMIFKAKVKKP